MPYYIDYEDRYEEWDECKHPMEIVRKHSEYFTRIFNPERPLDMIYIEKQVSHYDFPIRCVVANGNLMQIHTKEGNIWELEDSNIIENIRMILEEKEKRDRLSPIHKNIEIKDNLYIFSWFPTNDSNISLSEESLLFRKQYWKEREF